MSLQEVQSTATLLPLEFTPLLKRSRWGGERLGTILHKPIGLEGDYGESWELSDHPEAPTLIASGEYAGCTLSEVIGQNPQAMYGAGTCYSTFPLLIKFIDATDRLSLQVHPDDSHQPHFDARKSGKSEAWVILDAAPDSRIYAGLKAGIDADELRTQLEQGRVEACLHSYPVRPGDCVFIPAGTLHAIGEGILLAEVQQTSDITYRLFDWNRLDQSGQPRPLHVEQAFESINFQRGPVDLLKPQLRQVQEHTIEDLLESSCFTIRRHRAARSLRLPSLNRAQILIVLEGTGQLDCSAESYELTQGKTLLVPAAASDCEIIVESEMTFLEVIPG
ncbi:type I phosphomannose isomerase catalytic subunit [Gimesia panareensis]|uniref:type I phosphomannose isomerase catalytic subunit n=1 Tax=Gimesia panareensis TaxID=2527978 RepID=UPI001188584D|nr:type I phosphomannose isomerase catalytic subunit [Gimesia panareensis]QDU49755.1 putative mannose-6-phosphate isomerase GmuF [Gimesia panareensis]